MVAGSLAKPQVESENVSCLVMSDLYIDDDHELEVDNDWWNSPYRKEQK